MLRHLFAGVGNLQAVLDPVGEVPGATTSGTLLLVRVLLRCVASRGTIHVEDPRPSRKIWYGTNIVATFRGFVECFFRNYPSD